MTAPSDWRSRHPCWAFIGQSFLRACRTGPIWKYRPPFGAFGSYLRRGSPPGKSLRARQRRQRAHRVASGCRSLTVPCFGGPFGIPPPDGWKCRATVLGQQIGPAEAVPACRPQLVMGKLRHHVVVPQQDTVERPGGRYQLATALGENHALDQGIDRGILDAGVIARAKRIGRLGAPQVALLVAGREGLRPCGYDDIEVEVTQSILILDIVVTSHGDVDTETSKGRLVEVDEAFRPRRIAR